jgi:hypothetical protein
MTTRKVGTRTVGTVVHEKYGITVPLKLDLGSMTFSATWERGAMGLGKIPQRHTESGKDGEEVRDAMLAYIDAQMSIAWEPVIEVLPLHDFAQSDQVRATASCAMAVTRFWLGRPAVGDFQRAEWHIAEADRVTTSHAFYPPSRHASGLVMKSEFTFPYRAKPKHYGAERIYLAYTEELWAGLTLIEDRIREARTMLEQMLGTDDALDRVAELGAQVLPGLLAAPTTTTEE